MKKCHLPRITQKDMRRLVYTRLQEIDSPRSLAIYLIMRETDLGNGAFDDEVVSLQTDPTWFLNAQSFFEFYEPTELVRKWTGLVLSWDPEEKAREAFMLAEEQCAATNRRLRLREGCDELTETFLSRLTHNLSRLLGAVDAETLSRCVSGGGWGKGVTSSCKGRWLTEYHKLEATPQATRSFEPAARAIMRDVSPLWSQEIEIIEGSELAFVPKDARTHRSIAIEPSLNLFLQKGIGKVIRSRVKRRWRLDLDSEKRNQELARLGSIDGSYVTVDLSSASDTISVALVEEFLPPDWVSLLRTCRSTFTCDGSRRLLLNKWSSMGNGYTWELESAIFAAIVKCVIDPTDWYAGHWSVYGDDIIVPRYAYEDLSKLLAYLGFTQNQRKTFATTPFRESCGADYWYGEPVRPAYLKKVGWLPLVTWANWLRSNPRTCVSSRRTRDSISWKLGPAFPRVPKGTHGLIGLEVTEWEVAGHGIDMITRKGVRGYPVTGLRWEPLSMKSSKIDGGLAVLAHLRLLTARSPDELSQAWQLTARESGHWVRRRSLVTEWPVLPS